METLELKSGEKIKVLNGACMAEIKNNVPVLSGKVGGKKVEVLRDTGCSGVKKIVRLQESRWMKRILPERWDIL